MTLEEADALSAAFHDMMQGPPPAAALLELLGDDLAALSKVRDFPVRIKCALLAWSTLEDGIRES